jgi:hypothetical protein
MHIQLSNRQIAEAFGHGVWEVSRVNDECVITRGRSASETSLSASLFETTGQIATAVVAFLHAPVGASWRGPTLSSPNVNRSDICLGGTLGALGKARLGFPLLRNADQNGNSG